MPRSLLILSGGLDSTVSSWMARKSSTPVLALTFDYGQRASLQEQEAARRVARHLGVDHKVLSLPWLKEIAQTSLVDPQKALPLLKEKDLDDVAACRESAQAVWVPNRNGLFLNIAACYAESLDADQLVTGFNAEEGVTFPDNSGPFVRAADEFFWYSTWKKVRVFCPVIGMTKVDIARKAKELGVPLQDLWFCYEGGERPCRRCESCLRDFRALREAGIVYAD